MLAGRLPTRQHDQYDACAPPLPKQQTTHMPVRLVGVDGLGQQVEAIAVVAWASQDRRGRGAVRQW